MPLALPASKEVEEVAEVVEVEAVFLKAFMSRGVMIRTEVELKKVDVKDERLLTCKVELVMVSGAEGLAFIASSDHVCGSRCGQ